MQGGNQYNLLSEDSSAIRYHDNQGSGSHDSRFSNSGYGFRPPPPPGNSRDLFAGGSYRNEGRGRSGYRTSSQSGSVTTPSEPTSANDVV